MWALSGLDRSLPLLAVQVLSSELVEAGRSGVLEQPVTERSCLKHKLQMKSTNPKTINIPQSFYRASCLKDHRNKSATGFCPTVSCMRFECF